MSFLQPPGVWPGDRQAHVSNWIQHPVKAESRDVALQKLTMLKVEKKIEVESVQITRLDEDLKQLGEDLKRLEDRSRNKVFLPSGLMSNAAENIKLVRASIAEKEAKLNQHAIRQSKLLFERERLTAAIKQAEEVDLPELREQAEKTQSSLEMNCSAARQQARREVQGDRKLRAQMANGDRDLPVRKAFSSQVEAMDKVEDQLDAELKARLRRKEQRRNALLREAIGECRNWVYGVEETYGDDGRPVEYEQHRDPLEDEEMFTACLQARYSPDHPELLVAFPTKAAYGAAYKEARRQYERALKKARQEAESAKNDGFFSFLGQMGGLVGHNMKRDVDKTVAQGKALKAELKQRATQKRL